jgi:hypothetical protein
MRTGRRFQIAPDFSIVAIEADIAHDRYLVLPGEYHTNSLDPSTVQNEIALATGWDSHEAIFWVQNGQDAPEIVQVWAASPAQVAQHAQGDGQYLCFAVRDAADKHRTMVTAAYTDSLDLRQVGDQMRAAAGWNQLYELVWIANGVNGPRWAANWRTDYTAVNN